MTMELYKLAIYDGAIQGAGVAVIMIAGLSI